MKDFDNSLIAQIESEESVTFWLVDLVVDGSTVQYYSTLDINIVSGGHTYLPYEFEVQPMNYGGDMSVDRINLDFANVDIGFSAILLNNNIQGNECIISLGVHTGSAFVVEEVYRGIINEWEFNEQTAKILIVSEFVYWNKKTLRKPGVLCSWIFKGTECGYTGAQTECNKTYERCVALSRTDYFGGFRFFPAIEEREVWWGKRPA